MRRDPMPWPEAYKAPHVIDLLRDRTIAWGLSACDPSGAAPTGSCLLNGSAASSGHCFSGQSAGYDCVTGYSAT